MMAKLLYITCDLKPIEQSRSLMVGNEFLYEYIKWNPEDEIYMLDLYRDNIQCIDADVLSGLERMRSGHHFAALSSDEQRKIGRIWKLIDQFVAADKYVFVTPMLNMGFPVELRMYIDTVCVVNKTHRYNHSEPEKLSKKQVKKFLLIHSTNGFEPEEKEAHSVSYIKSAMNLIGIEEFNVIAIKGTDGLLENTRQINGKQIKEALKHAVTF